MGLRIAAISVGLALAAAAPAVAQEGAPYAPWDGSIPFNCVLQDAGTGPVENVPNPDADPFCVEFDKNSQSLAPDFGIGEFLLNEPGRVALAAPKCFYYQSDHWTGALVQGMPPELWHWDGQYFFDKAAGVGGVNLQNFRVGGQPMDPTAYGGQVPAAFAPYMDQGGGGAYVTQGIEADPNCAAMVDTPAEQQQVYSNGQPPPQPPTVADQTRCAALNAITGSAENDELIGGPFGDSLAGLAGNDLLLGAEGDDCLRGHRGNDRLVGGAGRDVVKGGKGDDVLKTRDKRRDKVRCGKGRDRARVDRRDRVKGCEKVLVATEKKRPSA
jgi:hypothetical protein